MEFRKGQRVKIKDLPLEEHLPWAKNILKLSKAPYTGIVRQVDGNYVDVLWDNFRKGNANNAPKRNDYWVDRRSIQPIQESLKSRRVWQDLK